MWRHLNATLALWLIQCFQLKERQIKSGSKNSSDKCLEPSNEERLIYLSSALFWLCLDLVLYCFKMRKIWKLKKFYGNYRVILWNGLIYLVRVEIVISLEEVLRSIYICVVTLDDEYFWILDLWLLCYYLSLLLCLERKCD